MQRIKNLRDIENLFDICLFIALLCSLGVCCVGNAQEDDAEVTRWIQSTATAIQPNQDSYGRFDEQAARARIIGLGEATHGQHETFELKRRLTMHLIKNHRFRVVAYEASAARAVDCDDYIAGRTDDRQKAIAGLGMLIWQVEENGRLLDDLRAWNESATRDDRVRFIGCDAQSANAIVESLSQLLGDKNATAMKELAGLLDQSEAATKSAQRGENSDLERLLTDAQAVADKIRRLASDQSLSTDRVDLRLGEFVAHLGLFGSVGARDKAMADLLLAQLDPANPNDKCVFWGHNGHVQRSPLAYMGSDQLAMGGHLAKALGERYYALGFAFGCGEFQANVQDKSGKWRFRRYTHSDAPKGSLDAFLSDAFSEDYILDLRSAPGSTQVQSWLKAGHGHRWWGGYNVPDDFDERTSQSKFLSQCAPGTDFDGLVFHHRTSAAQPVDATRIVRD